MHNYKYYDKNRLPKTEVFVFGSNGAGRHGKGAALIAFHRYGARYGQGVGPQGQSYAIPTKDRKLNVMPLRDIVPYIHEFVQHTCVRRDLNFYVTPIGTGLAGYSVEDIAPHFAGAVNCEFPRSFQRYLESES